MMYEQKFDEEHDLKCKIHRFEDKLLRSKNYAEQEKLRSLLMKMRADLQKIQWKKSEQGSYY